MKDSSLGIVINNKIQKNTTKDKSSNLINNSVQIALNIALFSTMPAVNSFAHETTTVQNPKKIAISKRFKSKLQKVYRKSKI